MPRVLAFLLAGLLLLIGRPADADAVGSAVARLDAMARARAGVAAERLKLSAAYGAQTREIAALKARPSSWARDRQLQTLLRSAKDEGRALSAAISRVCAP